MKIHRTSPSFTQALIVALAIVGSAMDPEFHPLHAASPGAPGTNSTTSVTGITAAKPLANAATSIPRPTSIRFRPLTTNAPVVRVTGGSRGTGDQSVQLDVLAPDDVGLTTLEQPELFWFQSRPSQSRFELTLLRRNQSKPLLRIQKPDASAAGIQHVSLAEHGIKLELDVEYQWVVALITDPANRSTDLVASGMIKRVRAPQPVQDLPSSSAALNRSIAFAQAGIWYDALSALTQPLLQNPQDTQLKNARAELLQQVGLKAAAAYGTP